MPYWNYRAHQRAWCVTPPLSSNILIANFKCSQAKQDFRARTIDNLPAAYHTPLTPSDKSILDTPVNITAELVRKGEWQPIDILRAYGKRALAAQAKTNCLTEVLLDDAELWLSESELSGGGEINLQGALAGVPVSLKDMVNIAGWDSSIGYSAWVGKPAVRDSPMVRLLKDAGAVPYVKTNVPITLLSFESTNGVFGRTDNPHVPGFSPGGSSGGEGALLAYGGSRIGVGTDVAGSVRVPAAWSGVYALRCSAGRFPKAGNVTSQGGQEGVPSVYSPMARSLGDLGYFLKAVVDMKPWKYDHSVHPIPWRDVGEELGQRRSIRWGVIRDDKVVAPTPAIRRALETTIHAVEATGDTIVDLTDECPSCFKALRLAGLLLTSDGLETSTKHFQSVYEVSDAGVKQLAKIFRLPAFVRKIYTWWHRYVKRDEIWAGLVEDWKVMNVAEQWKLVAQRESMRMVWHEYLKSRQIDFIITPVNALPAVPAGGMAETVASCGYAFLWNLLDYSAGVLPTGRVKSDFDAVDPEEMKRVQQSSNGVMRRAWGLYDAEKMHGLPTAVQIVGGRLQEEKVLWAMDRVANALNDMGEVYRGIEIELD